MLKLQERGKPNHEMWLVKSHATVGSGETCDFTLPSPHVAKKHIEILVEGDQISIKDCAGHESCYVNEEAVGQYGPLRHGDVIRISDTVLDVIDPQLEQTAAPKMKQPAQKASRPQTKTAEKSEWEIVAVADWLAGQKFAISNDCIVGRDTQCDITIPGTHLSRQHARFKMTDKGMVLKDLDSSNGTFVNDKRIKQARIKPGDTVRFDVLSFEVVGPELPAEKAKTVVRPADANQTIIRPALKTPVKKPSDNKPDESLNAQDKKWKTKPTSVGNRDPFEDNYAKPHDWLLYTFAVTLVVAGVIYFTLL